MALAADSSDNTLNLVNILDEKWTAANTDNVTPVIRRIMDISSPSHADLQQTDFVLIYKLGQDFEWVDLGAINRRHFDRYSIDIRTIRGITHLNKLFKETQRVLMSYRKDPKDDVNTRFPFQTLKELNLKDLSDKRKPLQQYVYDVELTKWTEAVST